MIQWYHVLILAIWGLPLSGMVDANIKTLASVAPEADELVIKTVSLIFGMIWPLVLIFNIGHAFLKNLASKD